MRYWIALLVVSALYLATPARADWPTMDEQIEQTNVILGDGSDPFCSGVIISKKHRLIATAEHCITDIFKTNPEKRVNPATGEVTDILIETQEDFVNIWQNKYLNHDVVGQNHFFARVLIRDAKIDTAVLQVVDPEWQPKGEAPFAPLDWKLKRGQTVYAVGNPAGVLDASITMGIVSNTQRKLKIGADKVNYFQIDAAIIGGNSGGAVYDEFGRLIGVVSAGMKQSTINFAVPISGLRDLLRVAGFPEFGGQFRASATNNPSVPRAYPYRKGGLLESIERLVSGDEAIVFKDR